MIPMGVMTPRRAHKVPEDLERHKEAWRGLERPGVAWSDLPLIWQSPSQRPPSWRHWPRGAER